MKGWMFEKGRARFAVTEDIREVFDWEED